MEKNGLVGRPRRDVTRHPSRPLREVKVLRRGRVTYRDYWPGENQTASSGREIHHPHNAGPFNGEHSSSGSSGGRREPTQKQLQLGGGVTDGNAVRTMMMNRSPVFDLHDSRGLVRAPPQHPSAPKEKCIAARTTCETAVEKYHVKRGTPF